jgi:hypothetical protein
MGHRVGQRQLVKRRTIRQQFPKPRDRPSHPAFACVGIQVFAEAFIQG